VVFDWGDTLMRDLQLPGPMVFWPRVEVIQGVIEALEALHRRLRCCVASGAGESDAELMGQALERVGLRRFFRGLWTSKELGASKPQPAFYRAVLDRLGLPPPACVMIGNDYEKDILPAKAAGMRTVWLAQSPRGDEAAADAIIYSMAELLAAIHTLGPSHVG
jgi:HAD superfamily hydrolase (TIGR01509 family)